MLSFESIAVGVSDRSPVRRTPATRIDRSGRLARTRSARSRGRFVVFTDAEPVVFAAGCTHAARGARMSPTADRAVELDPATGGTILFTDLVASTETMERVGDDRAE